MTFDRNKPFNDLPLLPPAVELETKAVLKQAIAANRRLADLKGLVGQIPNPGLLIQGIVLQEARLSSEIENVVTTNDELFRAAADLVDKADPATKEVLRYREALWAGFDAIRERPLSTNLFVDIVRIIKRVDIDVRKVPGTALKNPLGEVIYTPPEGETSSSTPRTDSTRWCGWQWRITSSRRSTRFRTATGGRGASSISCCWSSRVC